MAAPVRTHTGLLFADAFERNTAVVGSDWNAVGGSWSLQPDPGASSRSCRESSADSYLICTAIPARQNVYVQASVQNSGFVPQAGLFARYITSPGTAAYIGEAGGTPDGGLTYYTSITNEAHADLAHGSDGTFWDIPLRLNFLCEGATLKVWKSGTLKATYSSATVRSGLVGLHSFNAGSTCDFDDVYFCESATITMYGLPSGYKFRSGGVTSAAADGGTGAVTLDVAGLALPLASVEVLDGSNNVVGTFASSVYGGDVFTYPSPSSGFTRPVAGAELRWVLAQWAAVNYTPDSYTLQLSLDSGGTYAITVGSGISAVEYLYEVQQHTVGTGYRLRVRAELGGQSSDWVESAVFTNYTRILMEAYKQGEIRSDRGRFIDKGNFGVEPFCEDFGNGGAVGDGAVNDRAALADADTYAAALGAPLVLRPDAIFLVSSNLTISSFVDGRGGQIRPASGVTVTLAGGYRAVANDIHDLSLGGTVTYSRPSSPVYGQLHNDVSTNKQIWWNGSVWKDGSGNTVA